MKIGFLLFPRMTQLDLTGPFEFLASIPDTETYLIAQTLEPVRSDRGLSILPTVTYADTPLLDVFLIPGGAGTSTLLNDEITLAFVRKVAETATYMTSVCTGALVLGAAGLLQGRRATTHWNSHEFLAAFGAIAVAQRTVVDLPYITGGGVTAGIDFALTLIAQIHGDEAAKAIQLQLEYDPQPPFSAGNPEKVEANLLASVRAGADPVYQERSAAVAQARKRLATNSYLSW